MTGPESSPPTDANEPSAAQRPWNLRYLFFAALFVVWTSIGIAAFSQRADGWTDGLVGMTVFAAVLALVSLGGMIRTRRTPPSMFRWAWVPIAAIVVGMLSIGITSPTGPPADKDDSQTSVAADGPQPTHPSPNAEPSETAQAEESASTARNACSLVASYQFDRRLFSDSTDFVAQEESYDSYPLFTCSSGSGLSTFVIGATVTSSPEAALRWGAVDDTQTLDNVTAGWTVGRVIVEVSIDYSEEMAAARGVHGAKQNAIDTLAELRPVITRTIQSNAW